MEVQKIKLPPWSESVLKFRKKYRYVIIYGGRGSGKSYLIATYLLLTAMEQKSLILCGREYQNSIKDSVHSLLKLLISYYQWEPFFDITENEIICKHNKSRFFFKGVRQNIESIKSIPGITHLWLEEAQSISMNSWTILKPTIREEGSQIIATLNPKNATDCIYREFILGQPDNDSFVRKVNWRENPYFTTALDKERLRDFNNDLGMYSHIWEGDLLEFSDVQIFRKNQWVISEFEEPKKVYAYYGIDFGYSVDQTAIIRCYILNNTLYITHELYQLHLEIDQIGKAAESSIPGFKSSQIIADSARPDTISFLYRQGYLMKGAQKGKGSVEDGIAYIKSFNRVVIHPRCVNTANEFRLYSYKVDERSGNITSDIVDAYNHLIDALRYALEDCMKKAQADYAQLVKW